MKKSENSRKMRLSIYFTFLLILFLSLTISSEVFALEEKQNLSDNEQQLAKTSTNNDRCYLSDIPYDVSQSNVGWGSITLDQNLETAYNQGLITLIVDGQQKKFLKGVSAHATSTLIYNITGLGYDYFSTYYGVDASRGTNGNGVKFAIYTSADGENWDLHTLVSPPVKKGNSEAEFITVDIRGKNYIKLYAHNNGNATADHAVYANAKLYKEGYEENEETVDFIKTLEEYDTIIKSYDGQEITGNYELSLLQREFVKNIGYELLQSFTTLNEENRETISWLMNDVENLRLYMLGGTPDGGSYYNSLKILTRLYVEYSSDFNNTELLNNPTYPKMTYGDLYKKMVMSIALTHTQRVGLWMQSGNVENQSDPLRRYAIFKYMHKNSKLKATDSMDMTHIFEDLRVEEMRFIMNNSIDDEEILWLNKYAQDKIDKEPGKTWSYLTPHPYIAYVWPNYGNPVYYDVNNVNYFNELFAVNKSNDNVGTELVDENGEKTGKIGLFDSEFVIPGGKNNPEYRIKITRGTSERKIYKVWMNFRNKFGTGCVCGGISKSGSNIRVTHGIPATVIGQPGHAALLFYSKDGEGRGFWRIDNDVSGWTLSEKSERMLLGWGNGSYARGSYQVVYMELAQAAVNDYENLVKAEEQVMLAKLYNSDLTDEAKKQAALEKQEELYRKALEIQPINFDAWLGLIEVYNANETKTEDDFYDLAEEIAENLKYFPLPMYHATNLIKPRLTSIQNSYKFTLLQTRTLTEASTTPNNTADSFTVVQPGVTKVEANFLLGKLDKTIATFSFDGTDAGKIVLSSRFDGNGVRWDYCLTGKGENTDWENADWKEVSFTGEEEHKWTLTPEEISSITAENDIYVHIVGVNYDEDNLYKIDITEQTNLANLYANDLENRVVGVNLNTEWRYTENDAWTSYSVSSPDLTGNKTVQVRQAATGTKLTSPASPIYNFTEDNQPSTRKYIPVSHLNIHAVSTQATNNAGAATYAIDANYNTRYHSAWNGTDTQRYITIKLDKPVYLSAVEFVPAGGGNGRIVKGEVLGSLTGEDDSWVSLANNESTPWSWPSQANTVEAAKTLTKSFEIPEEKRQEKVQYVKIIAHQTNGNWFAARAFNLYQDITKVDEHPTAGIGYSTTENTSEPVVARLINPSTEIIITNNDGKDTYVFTENGEFTFEFEDEEGNKGSALAKVTWIDKQAPTVDINYKLSDDKKLTAILDNINEDVYLLDSNNKKTNFIEVEDGKIVSISFLDENEESYKVSKLDENKVTEKITYKNTTGKVDRIKYYSITFKKDENGNVLSEVESRVGIDADGNTVTLTESEIEELKTLEAMRSNPLEFYLEKNQEYEFILLDKASNIAYKNIKVDYIENDTKILASDITYSTRVATKENVTATIKPYLIDMEGKSCNVEIINNDKNTIYTFTDNGEFTFQYAETKENKEEEAEVKTHKAVVDWIDRKAPTAEIRYSTQETTNNAVVATLVNESEEILITNNGTSREFTFNENGEFTFKFVDKAGNEGTAKATVNWINKEIAFSSEKYKIENGVIRELRATVKDKAGTTVKEFTENVTTNSELTFINTDGKILTKNEALKTGCKVRVGQFKEYVLVVTGDINGDGKLGATDIAKLKKHIAKIESLGGEQVLAADVNGDGKVSSTDLARLKKAIIGLIEL